MFYKLNLNFFVGNLPKTYINFPLPFLRRVVMPFPELCKKFIVHVVLGRQLLSLRFLVDKKILNLLPNGRLGAFGPSSPVKCCFL